MKIKKMFAVEKAYTPPLPPMLRACIKISCWIDHECSYINDTIRDVAEITVRTWDL